MAAFRTRCVDDERRAEPAFRQDCCNVLGKTRKRCTNFRNLWRQDRAACSDMVDKELEKRSDEVEPLSRYVELDFQHGQEHNDRRNGGNGPREDGSR